MGEGKFLLSVIIKISCLRQLIFFCKKAIIQFTVLDLSLRPLQFLINRVSNAEDIRPPKIQAARVMQQEIFPKQYPALSECSLGLTLQAPIRIGSICCILLLLRQEQIRKN